MENQDKGTISNEPWELEAVAKKFNVKTWEVMKVKDELETNDRAKVEAGLAEYVKEIGSV